MFVLASSLLAGLARRQSVPTREVFSMVAYFGDQFLGQGVSHTTFLRAQGPLMMKMMAKRG